MSPVETARPSWMAKCACTTFLVLVLNMRTMAGPSGRGKIPSSMAKGATAEVMLPQLEDMSTTSSRMPICAKV